MQHNMADKLYDFKQMELDQRARDLQKAEEECRRAINAAVKDYNDALVCALIKTPSLFYSYNSNFFTFNRRYFRNANKSRGRTSARCKSRTTT